MTVGKILEVAIENNKIVFSAREKTLKFPLKDAHQILEGSNGAILKAFSKKNFGVINVDALKIKLKALLEKPIQPKTCTFLKFLDYAESVYGAYGKLVAEELLLSLACEVQQRNSLVVNLMNKTRVKRHILVHDPAGWFKTSIMMLMADLIKKANIKNLKVNNVSALSPSTLRGSVSGEGSSQTFFPPEALLNDIMVFSELSNIDMKDPLLIGAFLSFLEDGTVRFPLVKFGCVSKEIMAKAKEFGAEFLDGRLCYIALTTVWACTHSLEAIPYNLKQALVDRFTIVEVPKTQMQDFFNPSYAMDVVLNKKREYQKEEQLVLELRLATDDMSSFHEIQFNLAKEATKEAINQALNLNINIKALVNGRLVSEILRAAIAYLSWMPWLTKVELITHLRDKPQRYTQAKRPLDEILTELLTTSNRTMQELMEATGAKRTTILYHLSKIHAKEFSDGINKKKLWGL